MNLTFNLIDEAWLPCVRADGAPVVLSLRETLRQAHALRELQGESPLVIAAEYRLLLAILHRVFGPPGRNGWRKLWQAGRWDESILDRYFKEWYAHFDLFDPERPFYQVAQPAGKPKSLNTLVLEWASGNNAALFDHTMDDKPPAISAPYAARLAITLQNFHLAGLAGPGFPNFTDAPWTRGVVILAQGDTLFETLAFNLIRYDRDSPIPAQADDRPNWERDNPFLPERQIPLGYLDYLTWPSRRLKLGAESQAGQIVVTKLWLAPGLTLALEMVEDPMKVYRRDDKKGLLAVRFNEERALWRNSEVLFRLKHERSRAPQAFEWLASLLDDGLLDASAVYRFMALGMANDQAKIEFFQHEQMPLPLALLKNQHLVETLRYALEEADRADRTLYFAGKELATWFVSPSDKEKAHRDDYEPVLKRLNLARRYWASLEVPFKEFVQDLPADAGAALDRWRDLVIKTARSAFNQAANGIDDPNRGLKAVVLARRELERGLSRIKPKERQEQ